MYGSIVETTWHSLGTCAMKPRAEGGVLDARLNVYGTQNLKVCDLSLCPDNLGTVRCLFESNAVSVVGLIRAFFRIPTRLHSFAVKREQIYWQRNLVSTCLACQCVIDIHFDRRQDQDTPCSGSSCTHTNWQACRCSSPCFPPSRHVKNLNYHVTHMSPHKTNLYFFFKSNMTIYPFVFLSGSLNDL